MDTPTTDFVRAGSLEELKAKGRLVVHGPHRPTLAPTIAVLGPEQRDLAHDIRRRHAGRKLAMHRFGDDEALGLTILTALGNLLTV